MNSDETTAGQAIPGSTRVEKIPRRFLFLFAILFLVTQIPLYAVRYPNIDDYPNHLARLYVLANLNTSESLRDFYVASPGLAPNLALDILGVPLGKALGFETGVKLFASISSLFLATGTIALGFALAGNVRYLALGCLLFSYNAYSNVGTFNFIFGTGLALWLLAAWILVRRSHPIGPLSLIGFSIAATLLYLCHLAAVGLYLLGVFAWECRGVSSLGNTRRLIKSAATACVLGLPALWVHAVLFEPGLNLQQPYPDARITHLLLYKAILPLSLPLVAFDTYPVVMGMATAAIVVGLHWARARGLVSFSSEGCRIIAAIGAAMLFLPPVGFGGSMVDMRMGLPLVLVLWASLVERESSETRNSLGFLPWTIAAGIAVISAAALVRWSQADPMHGDLRRAMQGIEEGSKVAVVKLANGRPLFSPHAATWSVVDRSTFVSSMFVRPFQPFTLSYREGLAPLAGLARLDVDAASPPRDALLGRYDYAVVFGSEAATAQYAADSQTLYSSNAVRLISLR